MFWNNKESKLEAEKEDLKKVIETLEKDKKGLKEEVGDLKLKKKMEEEDIKHMVKIDRERKDIELEKEKIKLEGEQAKAIAKVKDEYRDKTEAQLKEQLGGMKDMYGEILGRLPNYNVNHEIKQGKK
jgi:3-hydroxyisobutyrate dehydrogenase-like beta-hydroxyacid dehydrogenase